MSAKQIILKNGISEIVTIDSLGLIINAGESSHFEYEEILSLEDSQELIDYILASVIIVNDGINDLPPIKALEYLQIGSSIVANYYSKEETDQIVNNIVVNNITNIENTLIEDYYTRTEVDAKIAEISAEGIKGAVNKFDQLPASGNTIGDIWIVRTSTGEGTGPSPFTPTGNTGLFLPFETTWQDSLGHSGQSYSSTTPTSGGFFNNAVHFDGHNDWIRFYSNSDFGEGPTLTVGGRLYVERTGTFGIIGRWDDSCDGWKVDVQGNKLRASLDTTNHSAAVIKSQNNVPLNEWFHFALVYDGNYLLLYINAQVVNSAEITGDTIDSYNMDVYVGRYMGEYDDDYDDDDDGSKYFEGMMCDLFIENAAMTQEQIEGLVSGSVTNYRDEGFYRWDGSSWEFLARNTGDGGSGSTSFHNSLLGLNSGDYQHLTSQEKSQLTDGEDTQLHKHDSQYYTKSEITNNFSSKSHNHDDRYYNKSQVDNLINSIDFARVSSNDSSTNITGAELEQLTNGGNADGLHSHTNSGGSGSGTGGLNDAYDNHNIYSSGGGREITVDFGPVTLQARDGFAPLYLEEINYTPNKWLNTGHICVYDSELFIYDATRSCWNSVSGYYIGGGLNGNNVKNTYLRGYNGTSFTDDVGWVAPWDGVIVSMAGSSNSDTHQAIELRINGNSTSAKVWYSGNKKFWANWIDVKFSAGDVLNFYATENTNDCDRPQVWSIIKRRIS